MSEALVAPGGLVYPDGDFAPGFIQQAGALCYRRSRLTGAVRLLLIGSRRNGRWGIPKGSIDSGETSWQTAARESFEEAGIIGEIGEQVIGAFAYRKDDGIRAYQVRLHLLAVQSRAKHFPEKGLRGSRWVSVEQAIDIVWHPQLKETLRQLPSGTFRP